MSFPPRRADVPVERWNDWRWQMANRFIDPEPLVGLPGMTADQIERLRRTTAQFPMAITPYYASLIDPDDPDCPIRGQIVPSSVELDDPAGVPDPLEEAGQSPVPGLVQIYPDRAALLASGTCPSFCRFCYRKRLFDPEAEPLTPGYLDRAIEYLSKHAEIRDVLVTGGDPLMLGNEALAILLKRIRAIPSVEIIRIGTRAPVTLPQRITPALCSTLERFHPLWLNTHFNHPKEITPEAARALDLLSRSGIPLGNQTVMLRGINDEEIVMRDLVHALVRHRVRPYYVFHCHLVAGTGHFRTKVERGAEVVGALRGTTSGIANPLFIVDTPHGKVPLLPGRDMIRREGDDILLETWDGHVWREFNPAE